MRLKIVVYAPPYISPVSIPEFEAYWLSLQIDPAPFVDPLRRQCRADTLLKKIAKRESIPTVYVVDCDGYYPGLNFVFGLALPSLNTAVVFTERLRGERFEERLAKEVTHEAGHLYGLGHCENPRCVMYFSNTLFDTDRKGLYFCERCKSLLKIRQQSSRFQNLKW
ncbi:MAG: archaemetzincin family Zn-dependent metalloprotease [Pyrobaculum sp.]